MKFFLIVYTVLFFFLSQSLAFGGDARHAIVSIYGTLDNKSVSQGTGFFASEDGLIFTAYHVIKGTKKIRIFNDDNVFDDDVSVIGIYPKADLAVLRAPSLEVKSYLEPIKGFKEFSRKEQVSVIGHPHGILFQEIQGNLTSTTAIESKTLWHRNRQIFRNNIKVYPIDITSDQGISGAPVFDKNENVIGVLSGSYGAGRTISWAIPPEYISKHDNYLSKPKEPATISWPDVELMNDTWTSLAGSFVEDTYGLETLYSYSAAIESLEIVHREIVQQSRISFATADAYMEYLTEGYSTSEPLSENDLQAFLKASDELTNDLKPFQRVVMEYTKAASKLESARTAIGSILEKRVSTVTDQKRLVEVRKILSNVISTDERSDTIFRQVVSELSLGLREVANGINHKKHLNLIDRRNTKEVDKEVKEILKIIHNGVFTIRGSLHTAHNDRFIKDSKKFVEKLQQIKRVSNLILYDKYIE